jgi:hypothetical protein
LYREIAFAVLYETPGDFLSFLQEGDGWGVLKGDADDTSMSVILDKSEAEEVMKKS